MAIAQAIGCHYRSVAYMRKLLGIPKFRVSDRIRPYLGQYPDVMVAEICGVYKATVTKHRRAEGIPKCSRARTVKLMRARREAEKEEAQ